MSRSVSAPSSVTNTSPCWNGLIVPGSTFRYGSHFWRVTLKPRLSRRQPIEEAATPLPSEETTPPVTNIYFGAIRVARPATRAVPDISYLSGMPETAHLAIQGFWVVIYKPRVKEVGLSNPAYDMTTYTQLWACFATLSIPTLCACSSEILIAATFAIGRGSNLRTVRGWSGVQLIVCGTVRTRAETSGAVPPSKLWNGRTIVPRSGSWA